MCNGDAKLATIISEEFGKITKHKSGPRKTSQIRYLFSSFSLSCEIMSLVIYVFYSIFNRYGSTFSPKNCSTVTYFPTSSVRANLKT